LYPPDYDLFPNARFKRDCGCLYDVVRNRILDPGTLTYNVEYYLVRPEQHYSYGVWNIMFRNNEYVSPKEFIMAICPDCSDKPQFRHIEEKYHVTGHVHCKEMDRVAFPEEFLPEVVYKLDSTLSSRYQCLCRRQAGICNFCKGPLHTLDKCSCDVDTVRHDDDDLDFEMFCNDKIDFERRNNVSPVPSFLVTDEGYCNTYDDIDDCELQYLLTLNDDSADDCPSDDERDYLKYNGYH
jgi:hypothetical protein